MSDRLEIDDYLDHMRLSIDDIERCTKGLDLAAFVADRTVQLATIKAIENIGEAARCLTRDWPEFADATPSIAWRRWIAVRNRLNHGYFEIDLAIVWAVVENNLPELARALEAIGTARA